MCNCKLLKGVRLWEEVGRCQRCMTALQTLFLYLTVNLSAVRVRIWKIHLCPRKASEISANLCILGSFARSTYGRSRDGSVELADLQARVTVIHLFNGVNSSETRVNVKSMNTAWWPVHLIRFWRHSAVLPRSKRARLLGQSRCNEFRFFFLVKIYQILIDNRENQGYIYFAQIWRYQCHFLNNRKKNYLENNRTFLIFHFDSSYD